MIRGNGVYKHGRSKDLLKYKLFKDDEFEVVGHHEGQGGIPIFECNIKDKTFSVAMKGTTESKKERMDNVTEFYGKLLTVKYQELSADGIPRFPVGIAFRDYE
jgi:DNA ligase-1